MPVLEQALACAALALPWILTPVVAIWRGSRSRSLDAVPSTAPAHPPRVTVIVPARNEARNIERCVRSILAARYPALDLIVVDDHSSDATRTIAESIASLDPRLTVISPPPLPPGWFGKPWACLAGARAARGELLLFVDADTRHSPDLVPRIVNAMSAESLDMLSIAGTQEMATFWERLLQPQVFAMLSIRYGGTESVNRSRFAWDKIANGQCIAVRRAAYDAFGGHGAVHDCVAEDLMLAQRMFAGGYRTALLLGTSQLSTRMYTSHRELVEGWRKNIFAGGIDGLPPLAPVRWLFPLLLPVFPLFQLAPLVALVVELATRPLDRVRAGAAALAAAATLLGWAFLYRRLRLSVLHALAFPLGAGMLLYIIVGAIARGRRVSWKGRRYRAAMG